jgi:hypothetical protein
MTQHPPPPLQASVRRVEGGCEDEDNHEMTAGTKTRPDHRTTWAPGTATVGDREGEGNETATTTATTTATLTTAASNCSRGGNGDRDDEDEDEDAEEGEDADDDTRTQDGGATPSPHLA